MSLNQAFFFKENVFAFLILLVFLTKGLAIIFITPLFQGPDEAIHYATIQYRAEPTEKTWNREQQTPHNNAQDISTYHYSEEVIRSAQALQYDEIKFEEENTLAFSHDSIGLNEKEMLENKWDPFVTVTPVSAAGVSSWYYTIGSKLEQMISHQPITVKMLVLRLFSLLLGTLSILFFYLATRKIWDHQIAILITTVIAFQPMFSFMTTVINIDSALYLSFAIFFYTGISIIKDGLSWKNATLSSTGAILGITAKGPGIVLIVLLFPLFAFGLWKRSSTSPQKFFLRFSLISIACIITSLFIAPKQYLAGIVNASNASKFSSPTESIREYLDKTIRMSEFHDTEVSYWGNFGWLDTPVPNWTISTIVLVEIISYGSIFFFLFRKKPFPDFLPSKTIILAALIIIFTLQGAIRFYDWRIFDTTGQILIGQPGRYFLPTLFSTILVVTTGIGLLLRKHKHFHFALQTFAILMILFQLSSIINTLIPRYYL